MAIFEGEQLTIKEFWEHLTADDDEPDVYFRNCIIGDENTSEAVAEFGEENRISHINKDVICEDCTFIGGVRFNRITFEKGVNFNETTFQGNVTFQDNTFQESAIFVNATFKKEATFSGANFQKSSIFTGAKFYRKATFTNQTLFQETVIFAEAVFKEDVDFKGSQFQEQAVFVKTEFQGNTTDFKNTTFRGATFAEAEFHGTATFTEAEFHGTSTFEKAEFRERADFVQTWFDRGGDFTFTQFGQPADFKGVQYWENTIWQWILWQVGRRNVEYTRIQLDHSRINNVTNPIFQRYVADLQYIEDFRQEHPRLAFLWRWSSDYGRSFRLWLFWSVLIASSFGLAYGHEYCPWGLQYTMVCVFGYGAFFSEAWLLLYALRRRRLGRCLLICFVAVATIFFIYCAARSVESLAFNIAGEDGDLFSLPYRKPSLITYLYFSAVTFTTLGFGDITPTNTTSEIWITIEVVLGYIMLGGLISIFANKLARRS